MKELTNAERHRLRMAQLVGMSDMELARYFVSIAYSRSNGDAVAHVAEILRARQTDYPVRMCG